MSYIEENGYFIFDGIKSSDYGVWINGGGTFDAPKRRYKDYTVPGRNGTLTIDEGVFEEIEVIYPAFIARNFPANIEAFRNQLMSRSGYVRMTDSYHPDEYYLAKYMDGLEADVLPAGVGGQFNLTFRRDPRRFLLTGETTSTIGEWGETETASGEIVTLNLDEKKAFKSVVANFEPVQDLNGYEYPWAGGNGKNILPCPYYQNTPYTYQGVTYTYDDKGVVTINGQRTGTAKQRFYFCSPSGTVVQPLTPGETYVLSIGTDFTPYGAVELAYYNGATYSGTVVRIDSTSGKVEFTVPTNLTFDRISVYSVIRTDAALSNVVLHPMLRLASDTDATWKPYANICPISGWTEANITRTGKNLIPYPYYQTTRTVNGVTFTDNGDGTITVNGTNTGSSTAEFVMTAISQNIILPSGSYLLSGCTGGSSTTYLFQWNPTGGGAVNNYDGNTAVNLSADIAMRVSIKVISGASVNNVTIKPMLRLASDTDDTYEKYNSDVYEITFPTSAGAVYGGTVDAVNGKLIVNKAFVTLTGASEEAWNTSSQTGFTAFYLGNTATSLPGRLASGDIVTNSFKRVYGSGFGALTAPGQILYVTNLNIRVNNEVVGTTVAELRTWLANNPIEIAYELATPIEYNLTPKQIGALIGTNTIWSDTQTVTVEYGDNPNIAYNPTLFEALPLIRVTFSETAENLVKLPYYNGTFTSNGITWTRNDDGTVIADGTATSRSWFSFVSSTNTPVHLAEGSYHFTCTPSSGSASTYYSCVWFQSDYGTTLQSFWDTGAGVNFTVTSELASAKCYVQAYVAPDVTAPGIEFNPVLVSTSETWCQLGVGDRQINLLNRYPYIDVDCDSQNCYYGTTNANQQSILVDNEFPVLAPGANNINVGTGIEKVEVTPRWYRV